MNDRRTALITGASAGLGKDFAYLFAKDGHDVVLVARSEGKLREIASDIEAKHGVKAHVVAADLTKRDAPQTIFTALRAQNVDVEFLVNNAGFGSTGPFLDQPVVGEADMIEVNCTALVQLTHLFAKPMVERKRGRILQIASTAGFQPGPFMATYYATKAFVISFSEALAHELNGTGVTVTAHCPGPTATEFAGRAGNDKSRLFKQASIATSADCAAHAYRAMMAGKVLVVHGFVNSLSASSVRFTPRSWVRAIAGALNRPA